MTEPLALAGPTEPAGVSPLLPGGRALAGSLGLPVSTQAAVSRASAELEMVRKHAEADTVDAEWRESSVPSRRIGTAETRRSRSCWA